MNTPRRGVDLSHHNSPVDFGTMQRAGIEFVALKASQGTGYVDPTFEDRRQRAHLVGFGVVLLYHFFDPEADAKAQAAHFAHVVGGLKANEIAVVDVEDAPGWESLTSEQSADAVLRWVYGVKTALNRSCGDLMLYGSPGWLRGRFGSQLSDLSCMKLWAARYAPQLGDVGPWPAATIWQNSEHGTVPGAGEPGQIDTDLWIGQWPGAAT